MSLDAGRALNRKEAQELAKHLIGPRAFAECHRICDPAPGTAKRKYLIREMVAVADTRTHGRSDRSYREAFHDAGIFWEE